MQVGWVKIGHFLRKTCYNSKTVQDRCIVSINPYVATGRGGMLTLRRTFYPVAPELLRIVTKAIVTFPEYMWAKMRKKISDISTSISNTAAG